MTYRRILIAIVVLSVIHIVLGSVSFVVGTISSIQAVVWMAHRVSPIFAGGFFILTGIIGFGCVHRQTSYVIHCFTAFSMVALVTAIVSIQLLRLGLVNHTTDGQTYRKEKLDTLLLVALAADAMECLYCIVGSILSCRMAKLAKLELYRKREGMFHVEVYGEKDVVVVTKSSSQSQLFRSHWLSNLSSCWSKSNAENSAAEGEKGDTEELIGTSSATQTGLIHRPAFAMSSTPGGAGMKAGGPIMPKTTVSASGAAKSLLGGATIGPSPSAGGNNSSGRMMTGTGATTYANPSTTSPSRKVLTSEV